MPMKYFLNLPDYTQEEVGEWIKTVNARIECLADRDVDPSIFCGIFKKFQLIDLEKGTIYSFDGEKIDIRSRQSF